MSGAGARHDLPVVELALIVRHDREDAMTLDHTDTIEGILADLRQLAAETAGNESRPSATDIVARIEQAIARVTALAQAAPIVTIDPALTGTPDYPIVDPDHPDAVDMVLSDVDPPRAVARKGTMVGSGGRGATSTTHPTSTTHATHSAGHASHPTHAATKTAAKKR